MGNIAHKTWSELLEKIEALKSQLDALENEVKEVMQNAEKIPAPESDLPESSGEEPVVPENSTAVAEGTVEDLPQEPIDISIGDLDIPEYVSKALKTELDKSNPKPGKTVMETHKADKAVMDVMAEKQAWRTDRPGSAVRNIISAISLNDRVLLIKTLFKEDPQLFRDTISAFNGMETLEEALAYMREHFPDWNLNSGPVYRLMMAVRRKLQ